MIKHILNITFKIIVLIFVFANMVYMVDTIGTYVHEQTHIMQIEEYGTSTILEVCYNGISHYNESRKYQAIGWVTNQYKNSSVTWNGASEPEAYANATKVENILIIIDALILMIMIYYFFIEDKTTSKVEPKPTMQTFKYPKIYNNIYG